MLIKDIQRERLKQYLEAEKRILINQNYSIAGRTYTRADLAEVRKVISDLIDSGVTLEDGDEAAKIGRSKRVVFIE